MHQIQIIVGDIALDAELNDSVTSKKVFAGLPIEAAANVWGDEIYFEIPVAEALSPDAREEMEIGELGYWPVGRAFCIFYGPTPMSTDAKPRAASPVNVLGKLAGEPSRLKGVRSGTRVRIAAAK